VWPAVQLDLYLTALHPIQWLTAELARVVNHRIDNNRPVIVDGVCALDAFDQIELLAASRDCTQPTLIAGGGGRTIEVARVRITEAGRRMLARHY
jgi:hypothetical protein